MPDEVEEVHSCWILVVKSMPAIFCPVMGALISSSKPKMADEEMLLDLVVSVEALREEPHEVTKA